MELDRAVTMANMDWLNEEPISPKPNITIEIRRFCTSSFEEFPLCVVPLLAVSIERETL